MAEVMAVEKNPLSKREPTTIQYDVAIENVIWELYYNFSYGKLVSAGYFREFDKNDVRKEYKNILNTLINKYGKPHTELYSGLDKLQEWENILNLTDLFDIDVWGLDRTIIAIVGSLTTGSSEGYVMIVYSPTVKIRDDITKNGEKETF